MAVLLRAKENSKLDTANHILPSWGAAVLRPYKILLAPKIACGGDS
jgi:hypothetical protein